MHVPNILEIVLFITALAAMITNIHWYNQMKSEPCVAAKTANMYPSYTINALMVALFIIGPVVYYALKYSRVL